MRIVLLPAIEVQFVQLTRHRVEFSEDSRLKAALVPDDTALKVSLVPG